jgi:hypothetical protein
VLAAGGASQLDTTIGRNEHFQRVRVHIDRRTKMSDRHNASAARRFEHVEA